LKNVFATRAFEIGEFLCALSENEPPPGFLTLGPSLRRGFVVGAGVKQQAAVKRIN
jgi:hypothetical protein